MLNDSTSWTILGRPCSDNQMIHEIVRIPFACDFGAVFYGKFMILALSCYLHTAIIGTSEPKRLKPGLLCEEAL